MTEFQIRHYQANDRAAVFKIGADTAYFGEAIEAYMEDRNVFLDAFYAYYTDAEPEHGWVACADGQVVGFLMGCLDSSAFWRKYRKQILPHLIGKLLRGGYHFGKSARKYIYGELSGFVRREPNQADLKSYPAHLHINVEKAWRGNGLGMRLMEAYLGQLRELGAVGVHLDTTSINEAACQLYEKVGFRLLEARPDRFWSKRFGYAVEDRCYGLKLTD